MDTILNLNVGILGHVNAGKTSLTRILSDTGSTAAFDKNPQSKERGITLDLGFSAFTTDMPDNIQTHTKLQFTLVDCPGHASLIRTIIGGAQIIDFMLLVLDVTKGFQTQTAECLVIGEITCKRMIVVLNKIDLLDVLKKIEIIERVKRKVQITLSETIFANSPVIAISIMKPEKGKYEGIDELICAMKSHAHVPIRHNELPFLMSVDHCFSITGQGTILTGTVLQGSVNTNDTIDVPSLKTKKKVKSIQMFKKPIETASAGDRIGVCVTRLDPKLFERGIICVPEYISEAYAAIIEIEKIKYYKSDILSQSKFHVTIGHDTVLATIIIFGAENDTDFSYNDEFLYQDQLYDLKIDQDVKLPMRQFALLQFCNSVFVPPNSSIIGSKLDTDSNTNTCRLAFWGNLKVAFHHKDCHKRDFPRLKIYKMKYKTGTVERALNENEIIAKNMFKKETDLQVFVGLKVLLSNGQSGVIESAFGQNGKVKICIPSGLDNTTYKALSEKKIKKGENKDDPIFVNLHFKRYMFDPLKKIIQ